MWKLPLESEGEEKLLESESYRKMEDVELVLRFFAYRHIEQFKFSVDKFLDSYLKQANNYPDSTIDELETVFNETIDIVYSVFEKSAFIPPKVTRDRKTPLKIIYDPMMQVFARNINYKHQILDKTELIKEKIYSDESMKLLYEKKEDDRPFFEGRYNGKRDIQARIDYFQDFLNTYIL